MVINHKVLPWLIAGIALAAILLIVLVMVTQAAPDSAPHRGPIPPNIPTIVSYQGQVNIAGIPYSGTGYFRFVIVNTGGAFYWSNDGTDAITPTEAVTLTVVNGLFNVLLGETNPITYGMFSDSDRWLRVWFDDGIHGVQLLEPDTRLTTAPFAFQANNAMTATYATTALTATNADTATYATTALTATNADTATYSSTSITSTVATTSSFAWNAANSAYSYVGNYAWGTTHWTTGTLTDNTSYHTFTDVVNMTHTLALNSITSTIATTATTALTATNLVASPWVRVYNSSNITITNATWMTLTFDSERWDTNNLHDINSNTSRLTAPNDGVYLIECMGRFDANTTGVRSTFLIVNANGNVNNGTTIACTGIPALATGAPTSIQQDKDGPIVMASPTKSPFMVSSIYQLTTGDYVECFVYQNSGVNLAVLPVNANSPEFMMVRMP